MDDAKLFWFFTKKVHERLTIFFTHKLPNRMELDDTDEQMLKEMYNWYQQSDLFSAAEPVMSDEDLTQLTILEELAKGTEVV